MLQQTRIEAALPYYLRFLTELPDVRALAEVPQEKLLKLWEGLGYYSRAKNLQKAAQIIVNEYDGQLPADFAALLSLPGIGEYTAGAIASIAYHVPVPAVDGNVMRVLARLSNDNTDVLSNDAKRHFTKLASTLVSAKNPGAFNQALMELGENICLPNTTPHCSECPLKDECEACACGTAADLPIRIKKTKRRVENRHVLLVITRSEPALLLLHRRGDNGLLGGMWEFPNTKEDNPLASIPESVATMCGYTEQLASSKHLFSHIEWRMTGHLYYAEEAVPLPGDYCWVTLEELEDTFPVPGAFQAYKKLLNSLMHKES